MQETQPPPLPQGTISSTLDVRNRPISYTYLPSPSSAPTATFLVFINGLMLPQAGWYPTISTFLSTASPQHTPSILTYDRFGQGSTPHRDLQPSKHTPIDVINDLYAVLTHFLALDSNNQRPLIFIANSIGCPLVRLYCQHHPSPSIAGLIFLDSMIANSDFLDSVWPDPDAAGFVAADALPGDVDVETLRKVRAVFAKVFAPSAPNKEGLDRSNLPTLLPHSDSPKIEWDPVIYVVGHDPETFAEGAQKMFGAPQSLVKRYAQTKWDEYNEGLTKLSKRGKGEVVIAEGCDHFVQRDGPGIVAGLIWEMVAEVAA